MFVCGASTLGIKRPKLHVLGNGIENLDPGTSFGYFNLRFLNDLWSIHGKMDIKFLFMDGNLDLCGFFSSKMYNSTGKARYPHSRAELSFVFQNNKALILVLIKLG